MISGFRRDVDENCALLGHCAASSGNFFTDVSRQSRSRNVGKKINTTRRVMTQKRSVPIKDAVKIRSGHKEDRTLLAIHERLNTIRGITVSRKLFLTERY